MRLQVLSLICIGIFTERLEEDKNLKENVKYGGIAQLGERLNGIQEASGSIPLIPHRKP